MTTRDHRFRPLPFDPTTCHDCRDTRAAPQHFGEHAGPVVPVPGFTCALVATLATTTNERNRR